MKDATPATPPPREPAVPPAAAPRTELPAGVALALKWIGGVTAVIGLVLGCVQLLRTFADLSERERVALEQQQVAQQQRSAGDHAAAWVTLEKALAAADEGGLVAKLTGRLDAQRLRLRVAQEDLAMQWLRQPSVPDGQQFSDVVDKLVAVLARGTLASHGERLGDLQAHLGWAYFLKSPVDLGRYDPSASFQLALQADPANVYAHAFWGHWILRRHGDDAQAKARFAAALAAGREHAFVRRLQLAAWGDGSGPSNCRGEFLRVIDEMYRAKEPIGRAQRTNAAWSITNPMGNRNSLDCLLTDIQPQQLLDFVRDFFTEADLGEDFGVKRRDIAIAMLLEATGQREDAVKAWGRLQSQLPRGDNILATRIRQALARLRGPHG